MTDLLVVWDEFSLPAEVVIEIEGRGAAARVLLCVSTRSIPDVTLPLLDGASAAHEPDAVQWGQAAALVLVLGGVGQQRIFDAFHHLTRAANVVLVGVAGELAALVRTTWVGHRPLLHLAIAAHLFAVDWLA